MAEVAELPPRGLLALRGDLRAEGLRAAAEAVAGGPLPGPLGCVLTGERGVFWMAPDELLLQVPRDGVGEALGRIAAAGVPHLAADVSDMRVLFGLTGPGAREVLAKLCPADVAPDAFPPGAFRRTRLGQVAAGIWAEAGGRFGVMVFRSVAPHVGELLARSAADGAVGLWD